jgi:hypothetical protein
MGVWLLGGSQILENPGFETGSTGPWAVGGDSVVFSVSTADQYTGDYSALVTCSSGYGSATPRIHSDVYTLEAGVSYFFRCAIKVGSGTLADNGDAELRVTDLLVNSVYAAKDINVSTTWQTFGLGWTQQTDVNSRMKARVLLPDFTDPETDNGGIFFDDLEIYPAVELDAGYGYKFGKVQRRTETRDRDGGLHSYIQPGGYRRFEFPGLSVDSAGRCAIASFWAAADICYLIENDTDPTSMYAVNIMEVQEPFQSFKPPYGLVKYVGNLKLESVDAE